MAERVPYKEIPIEGPIEIAGYVVAGSRAWWRQITSPHWIRPLRASNDSSSVYRTVNAISPQREQIINNKINRSLEQGEMVVIGHSEGQSLLVGEPTNLYVDLTTKTRLDLTRTRGRKIEANAIKGRLGIKVAADKTGKVRFIEIQVGDDTLTLFYPKDNIDQPTIYSLREGKRFGSYEGTLIMAPYKKDKLLVLKKTA